MSLDVDALDRALAAIVPDERDRSFVLRCVVDEGPRHHRVASWALLQLLAAVLDEVGGAKASLRDLPSEPLHMRLPPSVARSRDDAEFPIGLPTRLLDEVLEPDDAALAAECLRDGPPHHALANATMVWLLEAIVERLRARKPASRPSKAAKA